MRNALIGAILFIIFNTVSGQNYLPVPLLGQQNAEWCWAASMQMIINFHEPSRPIDQCLLAERFQRFRHTSGSSTDPSINFSERGCCVTWCPDEESSLVGDSEFENLCDESIQFSKRMDMVTLHYVDLIFSSLADGTYKPYNSIEDTTSMNWAQIKTEINSCRPFIVFISKVLGARRLFNHAVVAKGYYERTDSSKYILINDPKYEVRCRGCEFLLPESIFSPNVQELNSALEVVRSIFPKDSITCDTCDKIADITTNSLIAAIESNNSNFFGIGRTKFTTAEYNGLFNPKGSPQNYFATDLVYTVGVGGPSKNAIGLVALNTTPQLAFILDIVNGEYVIKSVSLSSCTPFSVAKIKIANPINPKQVDTFSNEYPDQQFRVIEYLDYTQKFYQVNVQGKNKLSPIYDYAVSPYKKGFYYPEEKVLNYLEKQYKEKLRKIEILNKRKKVCFFKRWFNKKEEINYQLKK